MRRFLMMAALSVCTALGVAPAALAATVTFSPQAESISSIPTTFTFPISVEYDASLAVPGAGIIDAQSVTLDLTALRFPLVTFTPADGIMKLDLSQEAGKAYLITDLVVPSDFPDSRYRGYNLLVYAATSPNFGDFAIQRSGAAQSVLGSIGPADITLTPIPAALPLLAAGLGALGYGAHRQRRGAR